MEEDETVCRRDDSVTVSSTNGEAHDSGIANGSARNMNHPFLAAEHSAIVAALVSDAGNDGYSVAGQRYESIPGALKQGAARAG